MSRKKLLKTMDKSKLNFKTTSQNGLKQFTKMHNLSQNELIKEQTIYRKINSRNFQK